MTCWNISVNSYFLSTQGTKVKRNFWFLGVDTCFNLTDVVVCYTLCWISSWQRLHLVTITSSPSTYTYNYNQGQVPQLLFSNWVNYFTPGWSLWPWYFFIMLWENSFCAHSDKGVKYEYVFLSCRRRYRQTRWRMCHVERGRCASRMDLSCYRCALQRVFFTRSQNNTFKLHHRTTGDYFVFMWFSIFQWRSDDLLWPHWSGELPRSISR